MKMLTELVFLNLYGNRCQGINSASLCSLAGRYDNPIPTRCPAPIDFLKIPAQVWIRNWDSKKTIEHYVLSVVSIRISKRSSGFRQILQEDSLQVQKFRQKVILNLLVLFAELWTDQAGGSTAGAYGYCGRLALLSPLLMHTNSHKKYVK